MKYVNKMVDREKRKDKMMHHFAKICLVERFIKKPLINDVLFRAG